MEIANFRGFPECYSIDLEKGESLLIYGENGSGKSSLFKSLSNFLSSSQNPTFPYIKNQNKEGEDGHIYFTFNDYEILTNTISSQVGEVISFGSDIVSTDSEQFLKTAELTKGFLDYRSLLAVYNHSDPQPNLFDLIVEVLLKDFIPIDLGDTHQIGQRFEQLKSKVTQAYNRNTYDYRDGIVEMAAFELLLRSVLNRIFLQLNVLLIKYFKFNLRIWYSLKHLVPTGWWREIQTELSLEIRLNGRPIPDQPDFLNEARLSALAVCLYLSILKRNPQPIDFKVLFLDDVFIGLDLSNRLPIMDIIKNEFSDYQVFISTYDRHLYELARRKFETERPGRWKFIELFVGKDLINKQLFDKPIMIVGESHFEKAVQYLHDGVRPDYPAAANYFRKALEELILNEIPKWETADTENTQLPDYQLNQRILRARRFLNNSGNPTGYIDCIISLLPSLLHPLSHHEIASPVYRGELFIIERNFINLRGQLHSLDAASNFRCCLEPAKRLKMKFEIDPVTDHLIYYELILKESLSMKKNGNLAPVLLNVHCVADKCFGHNGTQHYPAFNPDKKKPEFNYSSLKDAYDKIYTYLINNIGGFPLAADYLTTIQFFDGANWEPLTNLIVWV